MAKFLAHYDGWYARHVLHMPQTVGRILPRISSDDTGGNENAAQAIDLSTITGSQSAKVGCLSVPPAGAQLVS